MEVEEISPNQVRFRLEKKEKGRGWITCQQFVNEMKARIDKTRRSYDEATTFWTVTKEDFERVVKPLKKTYLEDENQITLFDL